MRILILMVLVGCWNGEAHPIEALELSACSFAPDQDACVLPHLGPHECYAPPGRDETCFPDYLTKWDVIEDLMPLVCDEAEYTPPCPDHLCDCIEMFWSLYCDSWEDCSTPGMLTDGAALVECRANASYGNIPEACDRLLR